MLDQQWLQFVVALCLLSAQSGLEAGYPIVGRASGTLAVQSAPDADWRVISAGGILPDVGESKTAATGPGHLQSDQGTLSLAPLSHVQFDLTARQATLLMGRVFCSPAADKPWTITAGTSRISIPAGGAEVSIDTQGNLTVTALKGQAEITRPGSPLVTVAERTVFSISGTPPKSAVKPLEPAAEQRLTAWTKQLPPGQGVGHLVIKDSHGGTGTRLNIARYHAEVVLQPPVALVKIDQSFYNPSLRQEEGEFIFNLPPGASVSRFAMFVTKDQLIEGEVIERRRADEVYRTIVRSKRDPAILEQIGDNLFKMRVFPIFAKDIKRILLDFTLPLDGRGGQYQMQLPLLSNLLPIWDFRLFGSIRGPTPLASAQCPTIPGLQFTSRGANDITFNFERPNYQPVSDLVVAFQQPAPQTATTFRQLRTEPLKLPAQSPQDPNDRAAALYPDGVIHTGLDKWNLQPGVYFQADLPVPDAVAQSTPADVLLMVDTSSNGTLDQVRPALQTVLASLRPEDRFRLVCVDVVARPLHEGWLQTHEPAAVAAYQKFEQQVCLGSTDMWATCQAVAPQFANHDPARRPVVIYIGDGLHAANDDLLPLLAERCSQEISKSGTAVFTINVLPPPAPNLPPSVQGMGGSGGRGGGFFQFGPERMSGSSTASRSGPPAIQTTFDGRVFLTHLTQGAGGRCFDFTDAHGDRARLLEWLLSGVPTPTRIEKLTVAGCDAVDLYHPANLMPGEPFRIVGRRLGKDDKLQIVYQIHLAGGELQSQRIVLMPAASDQDHLVGRYWATQRLRHLQRLLAAPATAGGTLEAAKVIVALSREWSLLTPQTAFLVLETEADYHTWNVPRQGRRRYWSAQDVPTVQPLPADWLAKIQPTDRGLSGRNTKVTGVVELDQQLETARKALEAQNYQLVDQILDSLQTNKIALASDQYRNLRRITSNRRGIALYHLGIKQGWFDLEQIRLPLPTGTDRLLTNYGTITAELLERHPFAEQLLQEISLPVGEMSLFEFSQFLKTTLGVNIFVDNARLEEESVNQNTRFNLPPLKKLSVQNAVHHVLNQWNLKLVEEPRRLVITTKTEAIEHRKRVLFPVQDLIAKDPKFDFDDLQDPIFDREQQILQRIETKLKKLTSVHLKGASLEDVIARMRQELDENILIDKVKLAEESVATDATDISCDYDNATLGDVLTWLLDSKNLTYQVDHEALVLTTKTEAITRRPVRVYSAHGLIFRDAKSKAGQPRAPSQWGGWGMGMGGMWGGGGFGGGMGGFGGGGMGGMGGGFGGGGNIGPAPLLDAFASDSEESATSQPENAQPPLAETAPDQQVPFDGFSNPADDDVGSLMQGIMQQTGGPPNSPWMEADGEGGDAAFFYPSLSFVFRQTPEAHAEITEYFRQQRALQSKRGTNPSMVPIGPRDALSRDELDVQALLMLIQQTTGGPPDSPWMEQAGQGGHVVYDRPRMALSITQHASALDEISGVLVRLRRERYALMHQSRPWEQTTFLGRQPGLFDGPWLTRTADQGELAGPANEPELTALQVRRQLTGGQWTWTDPTHTMSSNFTLSTAADRLQLAWQGWEVRLQGVQGSAYAPQLQYAELGTWGNAVRDWLDVELVFWPHRSNRDLATLFDVVPVPAGKQDGLNQVRLQFTPAKLERLPLWIHVVYDKTTGLPVVWESFRQGVVVQRFRFRPEVAKGQLVRMTVRQESRDGQLLGTGEWKPQTQEVASIADPEALPEGTLTVDRRPQSRAVLTSFETGWQLLRKGDAVLAEAEFRKVLKQHPGHPLAQFLLAWSLNRQVTDVPEDRLLAAYATVVQQGPSDLARTLTRLDSGRFSERQLYELLNTRPVEKRDVLDEVTLAKQSLQLSDPEAALVHAQGAWKQQPAAGTPRLEVAQLIVQSQLRIGNLSGALAHYEICRQDPQFTPASLMLVLETFEYYDRARDIASLYQELLQRKDPSITVDMRRSLLKKYADVTTDVKRWQALLAAIDLLLADSPDTDGELNSLADELTAAQDSVAAATLALQTKSPAHRDRLQHIQANLSKDLEAAQKLYWQLHQAGYLFRDQPITVASRLIEAKHPEQAVAVLEALIRNRKPLTTAQRRVLAEAYTLTSRPLDAQRAISE